MAERTKAPDSRFTLLTDSERAFWSSSEGVGSNPTSDKVFFILFFLFQIIYNFLTKLKLMQHRQQPKQQQQ
jgi:hypothetical protein